MAKIANRATGLNGAIIGSGARTGRSPALPRWYALSDVERLEDPGALLANLPAHAAVILRHTDPVRRAVLARRIVPLAHRRHIRVLIAGDARLAARVGADGVHLSEREARRGPLRLRQPGWIVTAAAHSRRALVLAARAGADAALLSPVFATPSHPSAKPLGLLRFFRLARQSSVPVIALGGITAAHLAALRQGPVWGVAAIGLWRD